METRTTLIRIKRPLENDSAESIILTAKRQCFGINSDDSSEDDSKIHLKKLCTIYCNDVPIEPILENALKQEKSASLYEKFKENFKMGHSKSSSKINGDLIKENSSKNRFKLICSKRKIEEEDSNSSKYHMFDAFKAIESAAGDDTITCNNTPMSSKSVEFVYDLYFTSLPLQLQNFGDNTFEIQQSNLPMLVNQEEGDLTDDEDDENDEKNWRNDYPEEDDSDEHSNGEYSDYLDDIVSYYEDLDEESCEDNGLALKMSRSHLSDTDEEDLE